jgi:hypothetical protein
MKRFLFLAAFLLALTTVSAQFNFGIKAGYNSSLNFENITAIQSGDYNLDDVKSELGGGFHAGVFARVFIKKFYIQPELLYNLQKKDYQITLQDLSDNTVSVDKFVTFNTIDVPLLLGYKILDLKIANLRAFAGPKFRLNAGSQISFKNLTEGANLDTKELEGEFKNSQVGLEAGAGIDVLMFALDFRFNLINDVYQANWSTKPDLNSNFVISLAWKLF